MRELEFLTIINETVSDNSYLGDDCAYIDDLGIYITQDSLIEDIHFTLTSPSPISPFDLGYKSVAVNLSDLAANASKPLYITIGLSMPSCIDSVFVRNFYKGVDSICQKYNVKVIGGDLTSSDKIMISVCAIGKKIYKYDIKRSFAKEGDIVIVTGLHGSSVAGLKLLQCNDFEKSLITAHMKPEPRVVEGLKIAELANSDFAMMDSSDGLGDALYKIAKESNKSIEIDFDKIPVDDSLKVRFPEIYKEFVIWGGEDFELVACVDKSVYEKLNKDIFHKIGFVSAANNDYFVKINDDDEIFIDENMYNKKIYKHFEE